MKQSLIRANLTIPDGKKIHQIDLNSGDPRKIMLYKHLEEGIPTPITIIEDKPYSPSEKKETFKLFSSYFPKYNTEFLRRILNIEGKSAILESGENF
jgi:hypothetical protein